MQIHETKNHVPIYTWLDPMEEQDWRAIETTRKVVLLPQVYHHVALMPDAHPGIGCTVGSVIAMKKAISPATVGVDLFCGMLAVKYNLKASDLPDSLTELRRLIEKVIPVGFTGHKNIPSIVKSNKELWDRFNTLTPYVQKLRDKAIAQCGSLGSGNHFYEVCLDTSDNVWLMLHSGSRNIGKELAEYHINIAKKLTHNRGLPDPDLALLLAKTPEFNQYYNDLLWAGDYADLSRRTMLFLVDLIIQNYFHPKSINQIGPVIACNHNYLALEHHFGEDVYITRKGAISAKVGELGIIPGSMGAKSFIVRGLGNPESFMSASHGAGRRMSRGAAKKKFTIEDLRRQTDGVECRKDKGVLDEIPGAYKSIEKVMANQADLVEVVAELHQVLCIKG